MTTRQERRAARNSGQPVEPQIPLPKKQTEPEFVGVNWRTLSNHATVMSNVANRAQEYDKIISAAIQCEQHFPKELLGECDQTEKQLSKREQRRCDALFRERMLCVAQQLHPAELSEARDSRNAARLDALMNKTLRETRSGSSRGTLSREELSVVRDCASVGNETEDHLMLIKNQEQMECFVPRLFPSQYQRLTECVKSKRDVDYCATEATEVVDLWAKFLSRAGNNLTDLAKESK